MWYHLGDLRVGNGGFSLRSKKLMKFLSDNWQQIPAKINPEDVFISRFARPLLEEKGFVFADELTASHFSKEGNERSVVWNGEFGFHGIKYTDISKWKEKNLDITDKFTYELDDYATLMKKYPVYDGTVHTFRFGKKMTKEYTKLCTGKLSVFAEATKTNHYDHSIISTGHKIILKRSGISFSDLPIPATEREIVKVETFKSFSELQKIYSKLKVMPPEIHKFPLWKIFLTKLFPNLFCPELISYNVYTFKDF